MTRYDTPEKKARKKIENAKTRQKYKDLVYQFKSRPCLICGSHYHPVAMDLHHVDPSTKDSNISKLMVGKGYEKIKQELSKCIALCAVCHRLLHAGLVELEYPMSDSN